MLYNLNATPVQAVVLAIGISNEMSQILTHHIVVSA